MKEEINYCLKLAASLFLIALSVFLIAFTAICIKAYNEPNQPYHYCK